MMRHRSRLTKAGNCLFFLFTFFLLQLLPFTDLQTSVQSKGLNYGIDTLKVDIDLIADKTVEREVRIYNLKNETQTFEFVINSFEIQGENGQIKFDQIDSNIIQPDILISPKEVAIPANSSKTVKIKFSVDEEAAFREYNYVIFVSPKTEQNQTDTSRAFIDSKIGILTFINVQKNGKTLGEETKRGGILEFSVQEFNTKSPIKFSAKIRNSGNIHFDAVSNIEIYNTKNVLLETIELKDIIIMPGTIRNLESSDNKEIVWNYGLRAGKYRAVLNVNSPDGAVHLQEERIFYIIPLIYLALSIVFIIFSFSVSVFIRKRVAKPE